MTLSIKQFIATTGLCATISILSGCSGSMQLFSGAASDSATLTTNQAFEARNPHAVKIYPAGDSLPKHYRVIGHASVENYTVLGTERSQATLDQALREKAASIGGKGVIHIRRSLANTSATVIR